MEVRWSEHALNDLERILRHISEDNPAAARTVIETLREGCTSLEWSPNRGRVGQMRGRRELVFTSLPYIAVYQVRENAVEISRIFHMAQNRR